MTYVCGAVTHRARKETGVARSLALRALAGAGAFAASMALGTGWAGVAPTVGAGTVSSRRVLDAGAGSGPVVVRLPRLVVRVGRLWRQQRRRPGPWKGERRRQRSRGPAHDRGAGADHPNHCPAGDGQPRRARGYAASGHATTGDPGAADRPAGDAAARHAAAGHAGSAGCRRAGTVDGRSHHTDQPHHRRDHGGHDRGHGPVDPGHAGAGGLVEAEVLVQPVVDVPRDVVPEPRRSDRSLIRSVIDTTSSPIGRRLVACLAGVLLAVAIGILAASIDDRTQLVRRIQESRHVDEH